MMTSAAAPAERSFRGAGCGPGCRVVTAIVAGVFGRSDLLLHDPDAHEAYGRRQAGAPEGAIVRTGRLTVDLDAARVLVDGRAVHPTATEARLLFALAVRLGRLVPHAELAMSVWGATVLDGSERGYRHMLRTNMVRVRQRLYPVAGLISTVPTFGYRLEDIPEGAPVPAGPSGGPGPPERWSWGHDACRVCGLTDLPHCARGYCTSCYEPRAVRPGRGRGAAQYARRVAESVPRGPSAATTREPS